MEHDRDDTPQVGYLGQGGGGHRSMSEESLRLPVAGVMQLKLLSPSSAAELVHRSRNNSYIDSDDDNMKAEGQKGEMTLGWGESLKKALSPFTKRGMIGSSFSDQISDTVDATHSHRSSPTGLESSNVSTEDDQAQSSYSSDTKSSSKAVPTSFSSIQVAITKKATVKPSETAASDSPTDCPTSAGTGADQEDEEQGVLLSTDNSIIKASTDDSIIKADESCDTWLKLICERYKKRLAVAIGFFLIIAIFVTAFNNSDGDSEVRVFNHGGVDRTYFYHGSSESGSRQPLVAVLHDYDEDAEGMIDITRFNELADENGFSVVYPQGTYDGEGKAGFNVGGATDQDVDDAKFVVDLMLYLSLEHGLSLDKLFVTGFGNGGDLCYLLACKYSSLLAAVAPVAGVFLESVKNSKTCAEPNSYQLERSLPIFGLHGAEDGICLWDGDINNSNGLGSYESIPDTFTYWDQRYSCASSDGPVFETNENNVRIEKYTWDQCKEGDVNEDSTAELWLYNAQNVGHVWGVTGSAIGTSLEIWEFFKKYL